MVLRDKEFNRKRLLRAVAAAALAFAVVLGAGFQAIAADDDEDYEPFEEKLLKNLLGQDKPPIEYRERSPLVVPPGRDLPPPENTNAVPNPAWPKDADLIQAKKKKKRPDPRDLDPRTRFDSGRALSPAELDRGNPKISGTGGLGAPSSPQNQDAASGRVLKPDELGYKGGLFGSLFSGKDKEEAVPFPGEPPRAGLTDPPVGYLTPSPNFPYGLTATKEAPKPYRATPEDRAEGRQ